MASKINLWRILCSCYDSKKMCPARALETLPFLLWTRAGGPSFWGPGARAKYKPHQIKGDQGGVSSTRNFFTLIFFRYWQKFLSFSFPVTWCFWKNRSCSSSWEWTYAKFWTADARNFRPFRRPTVEGSGLALIRDPLRGMVWPQILPKNQPFSFKKSTVFMSREGGNSEAAPRTWHGLAPDLAKKPTFFI